MSNLMPEGRAWQPMHVQLATQLWRDGRTSSHIAEELTQTFGIERTRNSVIGKLNKLGLLGNRTKVYRRTAFFSGNVAKLLARFSIQPSSRELGEPLPLPPDEPIPATAVTLEDRDEMQCVWPVNHGTPAFLYCGVRKAPGESRFCEHHAGRAYRARCGHA
jgi:hypothetical protein